MEWSQMTLSTLGPQTFRILELNDYDNVERAARDPQDRPFRTRVITFKEENLFSTDLTVYKLILLTQSDTIVGLILSKLKHSG